MDNQNGLSNQLQIVHSFLGFIVSKTSLFFSALHRDG